MQKSGIPYVDYTWNPITGCNHGCKYCYARSFAKRFCGDIRHNLAQSEKYTEDNGRYILTDQIIGRSNRAVAFPFGFAPTMYNNRLNERAKPLLIKEPASIFVGAYTDLFAECIPEEWITKVFDICKQAPQHTYLFLTKNPKRYFELSEKDLLPQEFWYGYTATKTEDILHFHHAEECTIKNIFISIEPIHEKIEIAVNSHTPADWIIVGAETGNRKDKIIPKKEWLDDIVINSEYDGVPIFMKESLRELMGDSFIQEFPENYPIGYKNKPPHCKKCEFCIITKDGNRGNNHYCEKSEKEIGSRYARTSPKWCEKRGGKETKCGV